MAFATVFGAQARRSPGRALDQRRSLGLDDGQGIRGCLAGTIFVAIAGRAITTLTLKALAAGLTATLAFGSRAVITRAIIARPIITLTVLAGAVVTRTIVAGAIIAIPVIARTVVLRPVVTRTIIA